MRQELPDTSPEAIGQRMAAVREARGLHQAAMARALDHSPQRYGSYERGRTVPPPDVLARFWQLTGATSDYVLFGSMAGMPMELVSMLQRQQQEGDARGRKSAG